MVDHQRNAPPMGFAGLPRLVSDPTQELPALREASRRSSSNSASRTASQPRVATVPTHPGTRITPAGLLLAVGVLLAIVLLATYEPPSPKAQSGNAFGNPSGTYTPQGFTQPTQRQESTWIEVQPQVGSGNTLSAAEIRYCLAEDVRLDAANDIVDASSSQVEIYNGWVEDYNSRCSRFRYRQGTLEPIRREIDAARSRLQEEGRARLRRGKR